MHNPPLSRALENDTNLPTTNCKFINEESIKRGGNPVFPLPLHLNDIAKSRHRCERPGVHSLLNKGTVQCIVHFHTPPPPVSPFHSFPPFLCHSFSLIRPPTRLLFLSTRTIDLHDIPSPTLCALCCDISPLERV
jgi:hypothetical protein